jgi:hypothetical protein
MCQGIFIPSGGNGFNAFLSVLEIDTGHGAQFSSTRNIDASNNQLIHWLHGRSLFEKLIFAYVVQNFLEYFRTLRLTFIFYSSANLVRVYNWLESTDSMSHLSHVLVNGILVCAPRYPEWSNQISTPKFSRHFLYFMCVLHDPLISSVFICWRQYLDLSV